MVEEKELNMETSFKKIVIHEEQTIQPMSDGTVHTSDWIEIEREPFDDIVGTY